MAGKTFTDTGDPRKMRDKLAHREKVYFHLFSFTQRTPFTRSRTFYLHLHCFCGLVWLT